MPGSRNSSRASARSSLQNSPASNGGVFIVYTGEKLSLERQVVPESFERESEENYTGPVNAEGKSVYGKRNPNSVIEARQRRLYRHQQSGLTARQLVYEHADRESIAVNTAWKDWAQVKRWNEEDWSVERDTMVARLASLRFKAINQALKKGQLQTAAILMAQLGACVQETESLVAGDDAVNLNISIEDKRQ